MIQKRELPEGKVSSSNDLTGQPQRVRAKSFPLCTHICRWIVEYHSGGVDIRVP